MSRKVKYNQEIDGSLTMNDTQDSSDGVIFKGVNQFIHNFHHPTGGGALPVGQNTFIGESAGNFTMGATATSVNEASNNVAVGFESLMSNTLGAFNVAVGVRALEDNTTGSQNYAFGHSALRNNTTGDNNSAIGYYSMFTNTTGGQNVAVGYRTLEDLDGANNNVAIGYAALQELTTGEEMVAIGMNAGRYISGGVTPNTTSTHSVYIGYGTAPSADGNTDEIVIGYNTTGNGSNTATIGNTSINDTYLFGQIHTENYSLPTADGTANYVLGTNGSGTVSWVPNNSGAFTSNGTTITEAGAEYDVDFVIGSPQLDDDGNAAHDARMFFDKGNAAFRAGEVPTTEWDSANVGSHSVAFGSETTASGITSFAGGYQVDATGDGAFGYGFSSVAAGDNAFVLGAELTANNDYAMSSGAEAKSRHYGAFTRTNYNNVTGKESQYSFVTGHIRTVGAVTNEIFLDGSGGSERMTVASGNMYGFVIRVIAKGANSNGFYETKGMIENVGGTTSLIGSLSETVIYEEDAGMAVTVTADDTNDSLKVAVTGIAGDTTDWFMKVELLEIYDN